MRKAPPKGEIDYISKLQQNAAIGIAIRWMKEHYGHLLQEVIDTQYRGEAQDIFEGMWEDIPKRVQNLFHTNEFEHFVTEAVLREGEGEPFRAKDVLFGPTGPSFTPYQKEFMQKLCSQPLRLYEVVTIWPGVGIELRDVERPRERKRWVYRPSVSSAKDLGWDFMMAARLIDCGDAYATSKASYLFLDQEVLDLLLLQLKGIRKKRISVALKDRERSKAIIDAWNLATLRLVAPNYPPPFDEDTGEPNVLVSDRYEILDKVALLAALDAAPRMKFDLDLYAEGEEEERSIGWNLFNEEDASKRLLFIVIEPQRPDCIVTLALNLNQADAGRPYFREVAGETVRFQERKSSDLSKYLSESDPSDDSPETESPPS